jgi:3D (Asp-Asp-Asp) domain-containing protein
MLAALAASAVIAVAVPISRSRANPSGDFSRENADAAFAATGGNAAAIVVLIQTPVSFTLHEERFSVQHRSAEVTVGQALGRLGIRIGSKDLVMPSLESRLVSGLHVYVRYAKSVRLIAGSEEKLVYTQAETVGELLAEYGIEVVAGDRIFPDLGSPLRRGMTVSVVMFREGTEFTEDPIAYETVYEYDASMLKGEERLVRAGADGYVRRRYEVKSLNGQELDRELIAEEWVEPTAEVVAIGTRDPWTPSAGQYPPISFDGLSCVQSLNVYATWYSAESAGGGTTATGTAVYKGIVAVDPRVIPLGTRLFIPGYGYGLAADTGAGIVGNMIDLAYGADDIKDWRSKSLDICILG